MRKYFECGSLFVDGVFTKKSVIGSFKNNFYCDFEIELYKNRIIVHTDLPLHFDVEYSSENEKRQVYAFLRYIANSFDFSFTLEFSDIKNLAF